MAANKIRFPHDKRKNTLALNAKVAAIRQFEIDPVYNNVARFFNCSPEQIKRIVKHKDSILMEWESQAINETCNQKALNYKTKICVVTPSWEKKTKDTKITILSKAVYRWIRRKMHHSDFSLTDNVIKTTALDFKNMLNLANFVPDQKWITSFRNKYNLKDVTKIEGLPSESSETSATSTTSTAVEGVDSILQPPNTLTLEKPAIRTYGRTRVIQKEADKMGSSFKQIGNILQNWEPVEQCHASKTDCCQDSFTRSEEPVQANRKYGRTRVLQNEADKMGSSVEQIENILKNREPVEQRLARQTNYCQDSFTRSEEPVQATSKYGRIRVLQNEADKMGSSSKTDYCQDSFKGSEEPVKANKKYCRTWVLQNEADSFTRSEHPVQAIRTYGRTRVFQNKADKMGSSVKQIENILENREPIEQCHARQTNYCHDSFTRRKVRWYKIDLLNRVVFEWILRAQSRTDAIRITPDLVREQALCIRCLLKIPSFYPSESWLRTFMLEYNMTEENLRSQRVYGRCTEPKEHLSLKIADVINYVIDLPENSENTKSDSFAQSNSLKCSTRNLNSPPKQQNGYPFEGSGTEPTNQRLIERCTEPKEQLSLKILDVVGNFKGFPDNSGKTRPDLLESSYKNPHSSLKNEDGNPSEGNVAEVIGEGFDQEDYDDVLESDDSGNCKDSNDKIIESYEEALRHLKPLENFVLLQANFRAIGVISQLEAILRDSPLNN